MTKQNEKIKQEVLEEGMKNGLFKKSKLFDGSPIIFSIDEDVGIDKLIDLAISKTRAMGDAPPITPATENMPTMPDQRIIEKFNEIEQAQTPKLDMKGSMRFNRGFWEEQALTQLVFYFSKQAKQDGYNLALKDVFAEIDKEDCGDKSYEEPALLIGYHTYRNIKKKFGVKL